MAPKSKQYSLLDLPYFSPWPARILGISDFPKRKKTIKEVTREYETEKWQSLLTKCSANPAVKSIQDVDSRYFGKTAPVLCYRNNQFYKTTNMEAHKKYSSFVGKTLKNNSAGVDNMVEIGCGYGSILLNVHRDPFFRKKGLTGLEYTKSGSTLALLLAEKFGVPLKIGRCDITKPLITKEPIPANALLFTSYVISSCVPTLADHFVSAMLKLNPKRVVHFEPCYEHCQSLNLFDLFKKRYIEINDYNTNLVSLLKKAQREGKIRIIQEIPSVFGSNPLYCASVVVWEPFRMSI